MAKVHKGGSRDFPESAIFTRVNECGAATLEHIPSLQQFLHAFPNSKNEKLKFKLWSKLALQKANIIQVHLNKLYHGILLPSRAPKTAPDPCLGLFFKSWEKKNVGNTHDTLLQNMVERCQNLPRKQAAFSLRENSPLQTCVSKPKENLPHYTVSHHQKCCSLSLLPSACPWPVTENQTPARRK